MFAFGQFTGLLASVLNIGNYFIKDKKISLVLLMGTYLFLGVTFLLLGEYSGAIICMLLGTLPLVKYVYEQDEEKVSKDVSKGYIIGYVIIGIIIVRSFLAVLPIVIAVLYTLVSLKCEERKVYRITELINSILWTVYSISVGGYTVILSTLTLIGLYIKDIYKYDIKKETEPMIELEINFAKEAEERENVKKEELTKSNESLKKDNSAGDILLTSNVLTGEKRSTVHPRLKGKKILGKKGYHTGFEYKRRK